VAKKHIQIAVRDVMREKNCSLDEAVNTITLPSDPDQVVDVVFPYDTPEEHPAVLRVEAMGENVSPCFEYRTTNKKYGIAYGNATERLIGHLSEAIFSVGYDDNLIFGAYVDGTLNRQAREALESDRRWFLSQIEPFYREDGDYAKLLTETLRADPCA